MFGVNERGGVLFADAMSSLLGPNAPFSPLSPLNLRIGEEEHLRSLHLFSSCGPPRSTRGVQQEALGEESHLSGLGILQPVCFPQFPAAL